MKKIRRKLHLSDEGFSLMELIVTMLVSAVVTAAAAGFLVAGVQFYNRANAETTLQKESQVAELFLTELIQESVDYRYVTTCPSGVDSALIVDLNQSNAGGEALESVVVRKGSQLWYGTAPKSDTDETKIATVAAKEKKDAFLADCIASFSVTPSLQTTAKSGNGLVKIEIVFEEANKTYSSTATVSLRNKKRN